MSPTVIAENDWLIAINKPAGLIAHSDGRTDEPSLAEWIGKNFPSLRGVGGAWRSPQGEEINLNGLVHRLDRTTSGVILAAKNDEAFSYIKKEFRDRRVEKKYLAWVHGEMPVSHGTIVAEIVRSSTVPKRWFAEETTEENPRAAITHWRVVERMESATLIEAIPQTGRTHQIRVHLAFIEHPLLGDHLYAPKYPELLGFKRPALHAWSIALTMPDGNHAIYETKLPHDFPRGSVIN